MAITRRCFGLAALGGTLALPVLSYPARATAAPAGTQVPGVYRIKVGAFEITVLSDGWVPLEPKVFLGDSDTAAKLLDRAFLPKDKVATSVNEWVVNTGDNLVLVDAGTSNVFAPTLGRMTANLQAAGIDPAAVDVVVLTHMHPDHAGGLLTTEKKIAFPNAAVRVHEAEYAFWTSQEIYAKAPDEFKPFFDIARQAIKPYADAGKVAMFRNNAEIVPGLTIMAAPGHTVGHSMVRVSSRGSDLLLWGDIVHNAAIQFPDPERAVTFDTDQAMAVASRKAVFEMVASDRLMIAGSHLPFPGLGHVSKTSAGYMYVAAPWNENL
jgi:glyoxylase-like metal-dependent hydrolase (beta-lactamase superfamily II)